MSKDQVWKIICFFHTNRPKTCFPDFSRLENDLNFFHAFEDFVETLLNRRHFVLIFNKYFITLCTTDLLTTVKLLRQNYVKRRSSWRTYDRPPTDVSFTNLLWKLRSRWCKVERQTTLLEVDIGSRRRRPVQARTSVASGCFVGASPGRSSNKYAWMAPMQLKLVSSQMR